MENEEEKEVGGDVNPDAIEAALGDDFDDDNDEVLEEKIDDEYGVDMAFSQDDPRDWY